MEFSEVLLAQQQVVRLQALLEASRQIHSTIQLDEVLGIVLQIVVRELELEGAFFTNFPQTYGDVPEALQIALASGSDASDVGVAETVLQFPLRDKNGNLFTELVVLVPQGRELDLDETDFLESLAVQAAVAIENARFHERTIQWQRVESDLASARQVQMSLVPQQMPEISGYDLAARSVTCYEVGGDYLDIVNLPSGEIVIVVADVAGKGLTSALVGSSFRAGLRAMVHSNMSLFDVATRMNLLHYNEGSESRRRYVTAILLKLDPAKHQVEIVNAGHNPGILIGPDGGVKKIAATGTPIGMLPFSSYVPQTFSLDPGSRLLVYTDGMTEVFRGADEFGEKRFVESFVSCKEQSAGPTLSSLWQTLEAFSDGQDQSDDMTALVLFRHHDGDRH
jgi:serine phosphatase RsbU (regulator of sigma subunit)